ncbi:MAG: hypothetical protein NC300_11915 [Bacteroidales bacterium]|nr:hypothetical protein [Clostridium sp.]MCM1204838.1 hypothetical protein [Bacteroidales bacterium]
MRESLKETIKGDDVLNNTGKKKFFCMLMIMCVFCVWGKEQVVYAAKSGYVNLGNVWSENKSKTYKKYDVTGDGKVDKVKITMKRVGENGYNGRLRIYVNNKLTYDCIAVDCIYWSVGLVCLKNGNVYFDIWNLVSSEDVDIHGLYAYNNGKLETAYDFLKYYEGYAHNVSTGVEKVKGNVIYVGIGAQFWKTGGISHNIKIQYKNGKLKRVSNYCPIIYGSKAENRWTAIRRIKIYEKPSSKKVIYTVKKGDVIKINKVVYKNKKIYFQVKNKKGKKGYMPELIYPTGGAYFKEAFFSG